MKWLDMLGKRIRICFENATHHEELPPARRTVLCVYGAVRGVGGIDSWQSDVEDEYHISAEKNLRYLFVIC